MNLVIKTVTGGIFVLVVLSSVIFLADGTNGYSMDTGIKSYTDRDPIVINGDSDLTSANGVIGGSGTYGNPYIIAGWSINATGYHRGIYLGNISKYVIVHDNIVWGATYQSLPYFPGGGISIYKSQHITIANNEVYKNTHGAVVRSSNSVELKNNLLRNNSKNGAWITFTSASKAYNNTCYGNGDSGINGYTLTDSTLETNNCTNNEYGISLWGDSRNNAIAGNNMSLNSQNGVYLIGPSGSKMEEIRVYSNKIYNNSQYGIRTTNLANATMWNNTIWLNQKHGIYMDTSSSNNTIYSNMIHHNLQAGIYMYSYSSSYPSDSNQIHHNNISFNGGSGIVMERYTRYNSIFNNMLYNNTAYGISISGSANYNKIDHNAFYFNHGSGDSRNESAVQASDSGGNNEWSTSTEGNYWYDWRGPDGNGDGIVDSPYQVDGSANSVDDHPLSDQPVVPELGTAIVLVSALLVFVGFYIKKR